MKPIPSQPPKATHSPADIYLLVDGEKYWLESASYDKEVQMNSMRFIDKEDAEEFAEEVDGHIIPGTVRGYVVKYPVAHTYNGEFVFKALNVPPEIKMGEPQLLVLVTEEEHETRRYEFEDAIMVTAAGNTAEFVATEMTPVLTS